jgi:hypothetical protein
LLVILGLDPQNARARGLLETAARGMAADR